MKRDGFTLIELLIVVAIIGILAAIAVPNFMNARIRAQVSRCQADMKAVATSLEQYFLDWNSYVEDHDWPSGGADERGLFRLTFPMAYMSSLPNDAFSSSSIKNWVEDNPTFEFGSGNAQKAGQQWPAQAYIIISAGPNHVEEVEGNDGFPFNTIIKSYDASNGIKSDGDIVRFGGAYNRGRILMDGKFVAGG